MPATTLARHIESRTQALGHEMFARMRGSTPSPLEFAWWQEKMLRLCMQDEWFKVQAFRFIDVLPTMRDQRDVARHLKEYFVLPQHAARARSDGNGHGHASVPQAHSHAADHEAALQELDPRPAVRSAVEWLSWLMNFRREDSPLARLQFALSILDERVGEGERAYVTDAREDVRAMSELVAELLAFAKAGMRTAEVRLERVLVRPVAQAVAARTYGLRAYQAKGYVWDSTADQVYDPSRRKVTTDAAVEATRGLVMRYGSNLVSSMYFSTCNGSTRDSEHGLNWRTCVEYGWSRVDYLRMKSCWGHGAYSASPCGYYGHGVGMCQYGANARAQEGWSYVQILNYYYTGISIQNLT